MCLLANNGRFGGTGVAFTPVAVLNDGLLDVVHHHGPSGAARMYEFFSQGIIGKGKHIYLDNYGYYRCKKLELTNRNFVDDGQGG
jgi:diacylglycerol kinase family enzyme